MSGVGDVLLDSGYNARPVSAADFFVINCVLVGLVFAGLVLRGSVSVSAALASAEEVGGGEGEVGGEGVIGPVASELEVLIGVFLLISKKSNDPFESVGWSVSYKVGKEYVGSGSS